MNETPRYLDDRYNVALQQPSSHRQHKQQSMNNGSLSQRSETNNQRTTTTTNQKMPSMSINLENIKLGIGNDIKENQGISSKASPKVPLQSGNRTELDSNRYVKSPKTPINFYANDYGYYEQRVTQRNTNRSEIHEQQTIENMPSVIEKNPDTEEFEISQFFDLQLMIEQCEPNGTIQLPEDHLHVSKLFINKPMVIVGSSTSVLNVSKAVVIDLSKYPKLNRNVVFQECTINFEYARQKFSLNQSMSTKRSKDSEDCRVIDKMISYSDLKTNRAYDPNQLGSSAYYQNTMTRLAHGATTEVLKGQSTDRIYPLFIVESNSTLELRDCNISSFNNKEIIMQQPFPDICFYLNSKKSDMILQDGTPQASIFLQSTIINDFYIGIQNNHLGRIKGEKLYFGKCLGHAINISNPFILEIKDSRFESPQKSGINIRFSKPVKNQSKKMRTIVLEKNEISKGSSYGISIFGENMKPNYCKVLIQENQILNCAKEGIGIKNLNINKVNITKNQIFRPQGNGIYLQNTIDSLETAQIMLSENKIVDAQMYGIAVTDTSCYIDKNEMYSNNKGGLLISGTEKLESENEFSFFKQYPLRNIVQGCKINNNKEAGIFINGGIKGPIIINNCEIYENMNGIYIKQQELSSPDPQTSEPKTYNFANFGDIVIEKCIIYQNRLGGVYSRQIFNRAYIKDTTMKDNKNYAVFIHHEYEKDKIVFQNPEPKRIRDRIQGIIGGSWGLVWEEKTTTCKVNKCNIF